MFNPYNYRGLTISSCLGKFVAKIMNRTLIKWPETDFRSYCNWANWHKQRPKQRTTDHTLVLNTCGIYKSKHKAVYMYFVDLEKTSVSVNINLLLYKSLKININNKFLQLIKSLYQDVHTCLEIDTVFQSRLEHVRGTILVRTFSIYLLVTFQFFYDLIIQGRWCEHSTCLMYAGDIILFSDCLHSGK